MEVSEQLVNNLKELRKLYKNDPARLEHIDATIADLEQQLKQIVDQQGDEEEKLKNRLATIAEKIKVTDISVRTRELVVDYLVDICASSWIDNFDSDDAYHTARKGFKGYEDYTNQELIVKLLDNAEDNSLDEKMLNALEHDIADYILLLQKGEEPQDKLDLGPIPEELRHLIDVKD